MAVTITGSRTRTLTTDNDNDNQADPGDQFSYELIITNSGDEDALDVQLDATENGYTITNVLIGPYGIDDDLNNIYGTVAGNTPLTFTAADITGNDVDPDDGTPSLTITHINGTAITTGVAIDIGDGTITRNGDGTFTFRPDAGFEGEVNFTYNTVDSDGVASVAATPATVNITVGDAVWYVNSALGSDATGDGTYENPFASLNPLTSGGSSDALDDSGDTIFVYANGANAYNSGILLESGQTLRGEGTSTAYVVNGITVSSGGNDTQIEYTTQGVLLNSNNTILGIDLVGEALGAVAIADGGASVGNLSISEVEVSGQGQIIDIDNGGNLNVTLQSASSSGSTGANGGVIDLAGVTGSFTVSGATTINGTHSQNAIDIGGAGTNLASNFAGGTTLNMGTANGVNLTTNTGSTTFNNIDVTTTSGAAFVTSSAGTLTITGSDNDITTQTGQILSLTGGTIGDGNVAFDTLQSTGIASGNAIELVNVGGGNGGADADVSIATVTIVGAGTDGVNVRTSTSADINIGTATINNTGGDGIELNGSTGSFTLAGGNIGNLNDPTGDTVHINGGTGAVDIDANLFKSSGGHIVEVSNHTTGTVSFGGNLTANAGGNNGILINSSSGTIEFTGASKVINTGANNGITITNNTANISLINGGLDIDTTSGHGIAAGTSGAGTAGSLAITGSNNTLNATSGGHAILMNGTDIGAGGITLLSVNASGGNFAGIWLKDTGTAAAGFQVTGTASTQGSGGTIGAKTGADNDTDEGMGIYLENVSNVVLQNMIIGTNATNTTNFGIRGLGVNNFTLRDSEFRGTFGTNIGLQEDAIRFGTQSNSSNGLTGTALFEGNLIQGGAWDNLAIFNNAAGSLNLTIRDSANDQAVFEDNGLTGNDGVLVEVSGAGASATINVTGVAFGGARGDHFQSSTLGSASSTVTLSNNTFINNHPDITSGGGGIAISGGELALASNYTINYNITGNTFRGSEGAEIFVSMVGKSGNVNGVILNNIIGTDNASNPQSDGTGTLTGGNGDAIFIKQEKFAGAGNLLHAVRIEGNQIRDFDASGIRLWSNNQGSGVGRLEATILNNIIEEVGAFSFGGINALVGGTGSGDIGLLGLTITGNTINLNNSSGSDGDGNAIIVDQVGPNAVVYVPGVGGPEPNRGEARPPAGGTASAELSTLWGGTNTLTNGEFPNHIGGGVDATLVHQLRNDAFVLAVPIMAAPAPGEDWEAAARQAQLDWLASREEDSSGTGGDQSYGDDVRGNDKPAPQPQPEPEPEPDSTPTHPVIVDDGVLSQAELDYLVEAAIQRWTDAGATPEQVAAMRSTSFSVADMNGNFLAASQAGTVRVDSDGAGHGWFLDGTPGEDAEYEGSGTYLTADAGGAAAGRMDLLTVVMHELGHQVGLEDLYQTSQSDELMYGYASVGTRRLPGEDDLDGADLAHAGHESYVVLTPTIGTLPDGRAVRVVYTATVNQFQSEVIANPFVNDVTIEGSNFADVSISTQTASVDSTTVDGLTLGDLVFLDVNANGVYDSGTDTELQNVTVSLYADDDQDGVPDGAAIATDTTDASGLYSFTNLADGFYIVAIDASNFGVGGALENLTSVAGGTDPDDDINNDDNGVDGTGALAGAVVSGTIELSYNGETVDDGTGQLDINDTLDFGFIQPNQEPTSTNLDGDSVTWTEGDGAVLLDSGSDATLDDLDSPDFDTGSLTVSISAGKVAAEDQININVSGDITIVGGNLVRHSDGVVIGTFSGGGAGGGDLVFTLNSDATPARVQALVRSIEYVNTGGDDPTDGDRTISWTLVDGDGNANGGDDTANFTTTVDVDPVNDEPEGADNTIGIDEDEVHTFASGDFGFTDPLDSDAFDGVVITTLPSNGTLLLSGGAVSAGQTIAVGDIASLTYTPDSNESGVGHDSFTFQVVDNGGTDDGGVDTDQSANTITFDIAAVNDAPTSVDLDGDSVAWNEGDGAVLLDDGGDATFADVDSVNFDTGSLTVAITAGFVSGEDTLGIDTSGSVTLSAGLTVGSNVDVGGTVVGQISAVSDDSVTIDFNANADAADVDQIVRAFNYANGGGDTPTDGDRTITWTLVDGDGTALGGDDTLTATTTVDVSPVNDAPTLQLSDVGPGSTLAYTENDPASALAPTAILDDVDSPDFGGGSLTVSFQANGTSDDQLDVLAAGGITLSGSDVLFNGTDIGDVSGGDNGADLVITFDTDATLDAVEALIHAIGYSNTSDDPSTASRTVNFLVDDGDGGTSTAQGNATVNFTAVDDEPTLAATGNDPTFTEGGAAADLFDGVSASTVEAGQTIAAMTLTVSNVTEGNSEVIVFDGSDVALGDGNAVVTAGNGLTVNVSVVGTTATLSFTGASLSAAALQTIVDGLAYRNLSDNPTDADRTVTITELVDSGSDTSPDDNTAALSVASTVDLVPVNDAPEGDDNSDSIPEDEVLTFTAADFSTGMTDAETDSFAGVRITTLPATGTIELNGVAVAAGDDITLAQLNAGDLTFTPDVATANTSPTFTFQVRDDGGTDNGGVDLDPTPNTFTLNILVPDAAAVAQDDEFTTDEGAVPITGNVFDDNGNGVDDDPDGPPLNVADINGNAGDVGNDITLPAGTALDLEANGDFEWGDNGLFGYLITAADAAATGAVNSSATDTFTYSLTNGNTATVTVTINGVASAEDELWGDSGNNTITDTVGIDFFRLDQGGDDTVSGLGGNDVFEFGDEFDENDSVDGGADSDELRLTGDYFTIPLIFAATTLTAVELITVGAGFSYDLTSDDANVAANTLLKVDGSALSPTEELWFDGSAETDGRFVLIGGGCDDLLIGGAGNDKLVGNAGFNFLDGGAGIDTVDYSGAAGPVDVSLLDGEAFDNGNGGADLLIDIENVIGTGFNDFINGSLADNRLEGGAGDDNLQGRGGDDFLDGGTGADRMRGGAGNDAYVVDDVGDVVEEVSASHGIDLVRSTISFVLPYYIENLTLAGNAAINGTGNAFANIIKGNSAANVIDGGGGADEMRGGGGDDTYYVQDAGDKVVENSLADGNDTVIANISYTLQLYVDNLILTGSNLIDGTGNELDNVITGNGVANTLKGAAGHDTLNGGGGNDVLNGGVGNDVLNGGNGNDELFGGDGNDTLTGGGGLDGFRFDRPLDAVNNVDAILDYSVIEDTIFLDRDVFSAIAKGTLAAGAFRAGTTALDADDRILYDAATGQILYDSDGDGAGAAILFATVTPGTALTHADFIVF